MIEDNKFATEAAAKARKDQENPWTMYFVVNESLEMGIGKIAAQCAHASMMILKLAEQWYTGQDPLDEIKVDKLARLTKWLDGSFRKVVLRADIKEWEKLKALQKFDCLVVIDAGLSEVAPNSETVLVFWPMQRDERPKEIKNLQTLR